MRIGIIGAGNIGDALVRQFRQAGHEVAVANLRGPETLADLAAETGAVPTTPAQAVRDRDVVVVTIPMGKIVNLPDNLFDQAPHDLIVIDTCNYLPRQRDGRIGGIEDGLAESRWVSEQLDHPVIKVFNNIDRDHLLHHARPADAAARIALPISGDDPIAKATVMDLVDSIGFDPVDAGTIDHSWRQQPDTPVYGTNLTAAGVRAALAAARPERPDARRATPDSPGTYAHPA